MSSLALAMAIGLIAWGNEIVGYDDPHGKVQLALIAIFCVGLLIGYRSKATG